MFEKSPRGPASLVCLLFGMLLTTATNPCRAYTIMGNADSYEQDGYSITFNCENGKVRLSFLTEAIVRVHMAPDGNFPEDELHLNENGPYAVVRYDWPGVAYQITEANEPGSGVVYTIEAGRLVLKVRKEPFKPGFVVLSWRTQCEVDHAKKKVGIGSSGTFGFGSL